MWKARFALAWLSAADQARLPGDMAQVVTVAVATRGRDRQSAFIDAGALTRLWWGIGRDDLRLRARTPGLCRDSRDRACVCDRRAIDGRPSRQQPFKSV